MAPGTNNLRFVGPMLFINKTSPQSNMRRAAPQRPHQLQWDSSTSPPKVSLPFDDNHPHLIYPSLNQLYPSPRTASGCNQSFCHNTLCGPIDWQTDWLNDRWSRQMLRHNSRLRSLDKSDAANNIYTAIPLHWHNCRSPTWSLTLMKHGPNPNPDHAMSVSYSLTIASNYFLRIY